VAALRVEPLVARHDRTAFSCGNESLDRYLQQQANQDARRNLAAVFVTCTEGTNTVVGYYTLSAFAVLPRELPDHLLRRLPRYDRLPAILLGRLAVDRRQHGQRLGQRLLLDALLRCRDESARIGALAVVLDAIDSNALGFYEHFGFQLLVDHANRLYLPMATIAKL
jgi:GNAT superfamily N-acetyltransferase